MGPNYKGRLLFLLKKGEDGRPGKKRIYLTSGKKNAAEETGKKRASCKQNNERKFEFLRGKGYRQVGRRGDRSVSGGGVIAERIKTTRMKKRGKKKSPIWAWKKRGKTVLWEDREGRSLLMGKTY